MRLRTALGRLAMVLVMVAGGTLVTTQPAQAATYVNIFGDYQAGTLFAVRINPWFYIADGQPSVSLDVGFISGPRSTSATGCKITAWLILDKPESNQWEGPRRTENCTSDLRDNEWGYYYFWQGPSSAVEAMGRVCIDLYYNNSTSSGWQRCANSYWEIR
jgi:hypothetical protein